MGKTYLDTVKYLIRAQVEVDGMVEKPDLVGAVFGQTEGLLGDELDLRELQKNGRIGRIEVDLFTRGGKSTGTILMPSSLDMAETSILAAALEVVDRVGPYEARIAVNRIEDSRNLKRKKVLDRARILLRSLVTDEIPESKELTELVREDLKTSEVGTYGPDKLPCGPELATSDQVIFVEGRADVINLLRNNIKNTVAIGGANVGATIARLGKEKEVTVFLDGDRGGDIILKELLAATDIDFVSRAPAGKEVEELTRKEIIKCLRRRVPVDQAEEGVYGNVSDDDNEPTTSNAYDRSKHRQYSAQAHERPPIPPAVRVSRPALREEAIAPALVHDAQAQQDQFVPDEAPRPTAAHQPAAVAESGDPQKLMQARGVLKELEGSLKARLLDDKFATVSEIPIREIMKALGEAKHVSAIVLDGIITQRLVDLAEQKGAEYVVGVRAGNISRKPQNVNIVLASG